jgi:NAD-dependent deacetylase
LSIAFCPIESEGNMDLKEHLQLASSILVVTGAGISVASGISPFRKDKDAIWEKDVLEKGTFSYFLEDQVESWKWYRNRFAGLIDKEPNVAHYSLVQLERWAAGQDKDFLLVTQNIDTLHRQAGSQNLIEIHGRTDCVRCSKASCLRGEPLGRIEKKDFDFTLFDHQPSFANIPKCSICSSPVRAHVLWFDEMYDSHFDYQYERALVFAYQAQIILFIGTSFSVGITDSFWRIAMMNGTSMFAIDPSPSREYPQIIWIEEASEYYLPSLLEALV